MIKKILSVLLCAVIALSFASCTDSKKDEKEQAQQKPELAYDVFDFAYASYDASAVSAYSDLCRAVAAGEENVRFNTGLFDKVMQLFYTSFPLSALVKDIVIADDKSGVTVTYRYSKEQVVQKVEEFTKMVDSILKECKSESTGKRAFAINAYNYTATHYKVEDTCGLNLYETFMQGKGTTSTCSGVLEYLLRQGGINAAHVLASDKSGAGWSLCLAEIEGDNYLFDPATEIIANGGGQLVYFGMTTEDAQNEGLSDFLYTSKVEAPVCDNPYFDTCRKCKAWKIADDGKSLLITQTNDEIVQVAL